MLILCVAASAWSQDVRHAYLCSDIGAERVFKVSAADEIVWEYPAKQCADAWLLPNGYVLMSFTDGAGDGKIANRGAREVTPDQSPSSVIPPTNPPGQRVQFNGPYRLC